MKLSTATNFLLLASALFSGFTSAEDLRTLSSNKNNVLIGRVLQSASELNAQIDNLEVELEILVARRDRRVSRGRPTANLDRRIADLQAQIDDLEDQLDAIQDDPVDGPVDPPVDNPVPAPTDLLTVADLLPQLQQNAIDALNASPTGAADIDARATTIATNTPFGAPEREYRNAGNGNLVRLTGFNQNTQEADRETDPNVLVGNLVTSFGSELFIPDINDFRPIAEQFRPIAVSAVNLLIALVNADSPDLPPIAFVA